jgi:16S rRNA (cytosine967-C5)-methyltransferase
VIAPARLVAARVLERVARDRAFADVTLEHELTRGSLDPRDAALATELVFGTLRWQRALDWRLGPHSRRPIEALDTRVVVLLRLTAYQLLFLERVPAFAAVNDAVSLARRSGKPSVAAFVNAVLRALARGRDREPALPRDPVEALAVRWSFPTWLAARWTGRYGVEEATALMRAMNERPPLSVRANTLRLTREGLAERLRSDEGLPSRLARFAPEGLELEHAGGAPSAWRAFSDGLLAVQDQGSMLVSHLLAPAPGDTVIDACAAPGTKTTHLAQIMENRGRIIALDRDHERLARVREAAARLGVTTVETVEAAVEERAPALGAMADRVLVDAPCSNLGVLRRNPEVKWRRAAPDIAANATRQSAILGAAATLVKPDGRLVYATCSLEPEENDEVVRAFLARHPEFAVDPPPAFPLPLDAGGFLRCLPHVHGMDGFTAVRLRRVSRLRVRGQPAGEPAGCSTN